MDDPHFEQHHKIEKKQNKKNSLKQSKNSCQFVCSPSTENFCGVSTPTIDFCCPMIMSMFTFWRAYLHQRKSFESPRGMPNISPLHIT